MSGTYPRPRALFGGGEDTVYLPECACGPGEQRGPKGGCCGNCGLAILSDQERADHDHFGPDHFGPDCPQCRAASEACKIIGGFAEAMAKAIEAGDFKRAGELLARQREEAFWKAFRDGESFQQPDGSFVDPEDVS